MIAILLAALGVPIWLVLGSLGGALWSRRRYVRQPGVFRLKERRDERWPRRDGFAQLVHDVLVVNTGAALVRTTVRGIGTARPVDAPDPAPDGFEELIHLEFDDGSSTVIAVDAGAADRFRDLAPVASDPSPEGRR